MALSLTEAARSGDTLRLRELLGRGANVLQVRDHDGKSPVHHAAGQGHYECLRLLLAGEAEPRDRDNYGNSPLIEAAGGGHAQCIALLLDRGSDINAKNNVRGQTALHIASKIGAVDALNALLDHQADVNAGDHHGSTPLHEAAVNGWMDAIELLLARGADPNTPDESGKTPLHFVATNGDDQCIEVLLARRPSSQYDIDVNAQDVNGYTALHMATIYGKRGRDKCIRALLRAGADVHLRDRDGRTVLDCVHAEDIRELLKHAGEDADALRANEESRRAVFDAIDSRGPAIQNWQPLPRGSPSNSVQAAPLSLASIDARLRSVEESIGAMQRQLNQLSSGHTMVTNDHHGHLRNLADAVNYLYSQIGIYPEPEESKPAQATQSYEQLPPQQQSESVPLLQRTIVNEHARPASTTGTAAQGTGTGAGAITAQTAQGANGANYGRLPNGQIVLLQQSQQPQQHQQQQQQSQQQHVRIAAPASQPGTAVPVELNGRHLVTGQAYQSPPSRPPFVPGPPGPAPYGVPAGQRPPPPPHMRGPPPPGGLPGRGPPPRP